MSMISRRTVIQAAVAFACGFMASAPTGAAAQYPERPLKLVVPYAAGGPTDILGRAIANFLSTDLKQSVVVENKAGAQGAIGAEAVARSEPDGYTLFMAAGSIVVLNPLLYKKLPYDPKEFRMLSVMTELPVVMEVHLSVPAKTVAEFVAYAKQNGSKINFGSAGIGGTLHMAAELFKQFAGIEMTHVPYKGSAPALTDLLSGQIQVMFDTVSTSLPHIEAGKLRALGVTTGERVGLLPDVPTIAESGYPDYRASVWYGVAAPKNVPEAVAGRLARALDNALTDAGFRATLEKLGYVVQRPRDTAAIAKFIDEDRARWSTIIKARNISLD